MTQKVVAFTGLSGVGKTTFLQQLAKHIPFQHLTGGSLVATALDAHPAERDAMRHADLDENQQLLVNGFELARDPSNPLVVMDGHAVIDTSAGLKELSIDVFRALGTSIMVHLEAEPFQICTNRSKDTSRLRPVYDPETLSQHQLASRTHASFIADALGIEFHIVTHNDIEHLAVFLR